ncbi:MAG: hypothetical protein R3C05_13585 [Pirellulaceae bacterium]
MPIRIRCTKCGSTLQIPDSARGKRVRCSSCQATLQIPAGGASASAATSASAPSPTSAAERPGSPSVSGGSIQVKCPGCKSPLKLQSGLAGKVVQCPKCQTKLKVPGGERTTTPTPKRTDGPAVSASPASFSAPSSDPFGGDDFFADLPSSSAQAPAGGNDMFGGLPAAGGGSAGGGFAGGGGGFKASANPYASPVGGGGFSSGAGRLPSGRTATNYAVPAVLMIIWALLVIGVGIFQFVMIGIALGSGEVDFERIDKARFAGQMSGRALALILQIFVILGSVAMIKRNNHSMARTAAVITAIPCFGCLIFPVGIWACVLLFGKGAERDFSD